jgi:hypothetical protein
MDKKVVVTICSCLLFFASCIDKANIAKAKKDVSRNQNQSQEQNQEQAKDKSINKDAVVDSVGDTNPDATEASEVRIFKPGDVIKLRSYDGKRVELVLGVTIDGSEKEVKYDLKGNGNNKGLELGQVLVKEGEDDDAKPASFSLWVMDRNGTSFKAGLYVDTYFRVGEFSSYNNTIEIEEDGINISHK